MARKSGDNLVGSSALAEAFGLTTRRIQQLAKDGVLNNVGRGRVCQFDWIESVKSYIAYLMTKVEDAEASNTLVEAKKAQAEADFKRARADQEMLKQAEFEGRMHRAEDVEAVIGALISFIRQGIDALPGRISVDAAAAHNAAEVSAIVKREGDGLLNNLASFGYDKATFAKLVRERSGWESDGDETGEGDQ